MDAEGYIFVEGRLDDMIIRGGENISPAEIEDTILRHEAVATAAVIGLPDEEWGEKIAVAVVAAPGRAIDAEQLCRFVRDQLGSIKTPSIVEIRLELPTTPTGKILRRQLRDELGGGGPA